MKVVLLLLVVVGAAVAVIDNPLGIRADCDLVDEVFFQKAKNLSEHKLDMVVERLKKDKNLNTEEAEHIRHSFLQWASLRWITKEPLSPSLAVDDFWHSFLLFTKPYQRWCRKHFGKFIHHVPTDGPDDGMWAKTTELMLKVYGVDWNAPTSNCGSCHDFGAGCGSCGSNCKAGEAGCSNCGSNCKGAEGAGCGSHCGSGKPEGGSCGSHCGSGKGAGCGSCGSGN